MAGLLFRYFFGAKCRITLSFPSPSLRGKVMSLKKSNCAIMQQRDSLSQPQTAASCLSRNHRLLPTLANNSIGHHRDKLGAGYARPMRALAVARRPDGRPPPLACFLNASRLGREPISVPQFVDFSTACSALLQESRPKGPDSQVSATEKKTS